MSKVGSRKGQVANLWFLALSIVMSQPIQTLRVPRVMVRTLPRWRR